MSDILLTSYIVIGVLNQPTYLGPWMALPGLGFRCLMASWPVFLGDCPTPGEMGDQP